MANSKKYYVYRCKYCGEIFQKKAPLIGGVPVSLHKAASSETVIHQCDSDGSRLGIAELIGASDFGPELD